MMRFLLDYWSDIIGWVLALFSIIYAVIESLKNKKLRDNIRFNNWILYQRVSNIGGTIQKSLQKVSASNINNDILENIVRSDALCGELMKETIRNIYTYEPSFQQKDIDRWVSEGKISEGYADLFKKFMLSNR